MQIFKGVRAILLDPSGSLHDLAKAVGQSPEELFEGEDFDGVDLRDEPIALLLQVDADFSGAILTRAQARALNEGRGIRAERIRKAKFNALQSARYNSMKSFVERYFKEHRREDALASLWNPLANSITKTGEWDASIRHYAVNAVRFLASQFDELTSSINEVMLSYLVRIKMMKLPVEVGVMSVLLKLDVDTSPDTIEKVIDFDNCTEEFVTLWLNSLRLLHTSNSEWPSNAPQIFLSESKIDMIAKDIDPYYHALRVAVSAPTQAPTRYYENILPRARSLEELQALAHLLSVKRSDRSIIALVARLLAQASTEERYITQVALDEKIDAKMRDGFRALIIASGSPEGRQSLIKIISERGETASGIEVDSILMGLNFEQSITFMRPYWKGLTSHHRAVALDAIASKATDEDERQRVTRLRTLV